MNINIQGRHLNITDAIKEYARKKAFNLEKYFKRISNIEMILDIEGDNHVAEMIVTVPRGHTLIGVVTHMNMYASIDLVVDKVERQLTKYKEKLHGRKINKSNLIAETAEEAINKENIDAETD